MSGFKLHLEELNHCPAFKLKHTAMTFWQVHVFCTLLGVRGGAWRCCKCAATAIGFTYNKDGNTGVAESELCNFVSFPKCPTQIKNDHS